MSIEDDVVRILSEREENELVDEAGVPYRHREQISAYVRAKLAEMGEEIKAEFDPTRTTVPIMHDELGVQAALEIRYSAYLAENIFSKVDAAVERLCGKSGG